MTKFINEDHQRVAGANANVNHPAHYQQMVINGQGYESVDLIQSFLDALDLPATPSGYLFNILKYVLRFPYKHTDDPLEDLNKARFYLLRLQDYRKHFPFDVQHFDAIILYHQFNEPYPIDNEVLIDEIVHCLSQKYVSYVEPLSTFFNSLIVGDFYKAEHSLVDLIDVIQNIHRSTK